MFDARPKLGGLNEYGVAAYKVAGEIAQREVEYLLAVGNIEVHAGKALGRDISLAQLRRDYDAVFLGAGLGGVNGLGIEEGGIAGVYDAIEYIETLRQAKDLGTLPVGRRIVVIGGGMTAIDIACQTRRLGAEDVTIVYRRGQEQMSASDKEQDWAQTNGVRIKHWSKPMRLVTEESAVSAVEFEYTKLDASGKLAGTGERYTLAADMVFKAIGQTLVAGPFRRQGRTAAGDARRSHPRRCRAPLLARRRMGGRRLRRRRAGPHGRSRGRRQAGRPVDRHVSARRGKQGGLHG